MYRNLSPGAIGIKEPWEKCLELAQLGGFQGIDVGIKALAESGPPEHWRKVLADHGLVPGGFGIPVGRDTPEEELAEGLEKTRELCRYAVALGTNRVGMAILSWSDERPFDEEFEFQVSKLKPIAQVLADEGCRLGLEFLGPKTLRDGHQYEFIHTMEGMLELCSAIGTGNVGLLLDVWHWYTSGGTLEEIRALSDADVVYVHINDAPAGIPVDEQIDNVRCLPGETGVIDLAGFLQALNDIGYTGPVTPEPFSQRVREMSPEDAARTTGEALKEVWQAAGLAE